MTEPITNPETLLMQERLRALARTMLEIADEIEASEIIDDPEYTAGMMRLQAQQVNEQADQLEDDDDLSKINVYITRHELEMVRLRSNMTKADDAKKNATHYTRKEAFWRTAMLIATGILLLNLGFQLGRAVAGL